MEDIKKLYEEIKEANKNRAAAYYHLYKTMVQELGTEKADEIFKKAIHERGREKSLKTYPDEAKKGDLKAIGEKFCEKNPVKEYLFNPNIENLTEDSLTITMTKCPLHEQWKEMGLSKEEISKMCEVSRALDHGTFEGALGQKLKFLGTLADGEDRCTLLVTKDA